MVDIALAINDINPSTSPTYDKIGTENPILRLSQMSDASISRMAVPICIEVSEPGKPYMKASLQLGVWCCAGLLKLQGVTDPVRQKGQYDSNLAWMDRNRYGPEDAYSVYRS